MKKLIIFFAALLISSITFGQLTGTKNIPGDYATLVAAVADLNTVGVGAGGVTFNVAAGYTETITSAISITATGTLPNQIIFQKSGVGANPLITGYVGTSTPGSAVQDGIWNLIGSDYITIDGIDLLDPNTTNPATMEYGYAMFKASVTDGCQFNTIKNCVVTLSRNNNATGSGPSVEGSKAINVMNALVTAQTTALTPTSITGTNSDNKFYGNTLQNCNYGIAIIGYAAPTPFTLADFRNDIGGSGVLTGNTIKNYGGAAAAANPAAAVRTLAQYDINVSYNVVNNNDGGGVNHPNTLRGIYLNTALSANATISHNTLTIASGTVGANQVSVIENVSGSTAAGNTININYNTITGGSNSTTTSGIYYCILNSATPAILNINNNTITGNTISGTSTTPFVETGSPTTANVNDNVISNNTRTGASGTWYLIKTTSPANLFVNNNTIDNNNWNNILSTGSTYAFYGLSSSVNVTILNNIISNMATTTTGTICGIREYGAAGIKTIQHNQIYNIGCGGAGTIYGIYTTIGSIDISKNNIYNLTSLTGTAAVVYGIYISGGTTANVYNNYVSDLKAMAATGVNAINGIYFTGVPTANAYYNTVYLNATSSSVTTFGTTGIYKSSTTTGDFRNNIIINASTPGATGGFAVAYRWSGLYNGTYYAAVSNNNDFYAGAPAANHLIFYDGTNSYQTLAAYQTLVTPKENMSISTLPPFINIATTPYDLHIQTTIATGCESGGQRITTPITVTNDYDSDLRWGEIGYINGGFSTDIGADEFNGLPSFTCAVPAPGNTISTATTICLGQSITLSLQNATAGTGVAYQWQSSPNGTIYTDIPGATSSTYIVIPTAVTYYRCNVTCNAGPTTVASAPVQITFANSILSTTPSSRCGAGTLSLAATGSGGTTLNWYAAPTGGSSLGTGSSFTTPIIPVTTTYYVGAEVSSPVTATLGVGVATNTTSTYPAAYGTYWGNARAQYLILASELTSAGLSAGNITSLAFDVTALGTPAALTGYAISLGNTALTSLTTFQTVSTLVYGPVNYTPAVGSFASNTHTFATPFNWDGISNIIVEVCFNNGVTGTNNALTRLTATAYTSSIYYGTDGVVPGGVCGNATTSGSSSSRPNMQFAGTGTCSSPRSAVIATIGASPVLTITPNQTICNNTVDTISVTSTLADYDSYTWSPVTDLYTDLACTVPYVALANASTVYVKSTTPGAVTYTCNANNSMTSCSNIATTIVTVQPANSIIATASLATVCVGSPTSLSASVVTNGSATIGSATNLTGTTEELTAFSNRRASYRMQTVYTAAELIAGGLSAGPITSIAFDITTIGDAATNANYTVKVGTTGLSVFTDFISSAGFTTVFPAATYTHAVGINTITFTTPYNWDGVSNLVIEVSHDGIDALYNAQTYYTTTAGNTVAYSYNGNAIGTPSNERFNIVITGSPAPIPSAYSWSDGAIVVGTTNPLIVSPTVNTTYQATATILGCPVVSNTVSVIASPLPSTPTANNSNQCGAAVPACSVTSTTGLPSPVFYWYTVSTGGTAIAGVNSANYTGSPISVPTHFYVSEYNGTCESARVDVFANVSVAPALTITADQTVCNSSVGTITVTSSLPDFDTYTWSPVTDLYTDLACTVPYVALASATTVYVKSTTPGATTYTCNSINISSNCTNIATTTVTVTPVAPVISAPSDPFCLSGSVAISTLPATGYGAATFQWQNSSDNITFTDIIGATTLNYTTPVITNTTYYKLQIKLGATVCSESNVITVTINNPQIAGTTPGIRCGTGTVTLGATGSVGATLNWYAAATGGSSLGTGSSFTTPVISTTTDYYVEPSIGSTSYTVGAPNTSISGSLASQTTTTSGINFDVLSPSVTINSIDVYPTAAIGSTFTITVKQGVTVIATYTGTTTVQGTIIAPVVQTVPVNFVIPAGTGYQVTLPTNPGIIRNSGGDAFPYTVPGIISLTSSTLSGYYYNFYHWQVSVGCYAPRTLVTATVTTPPAITVLASPSTICEADTSNLTVTSSNAGYIYTWSPTTIPAVGASVDAAPIVTTVYYVTAADNSGGAYNGCVAVGTTTVNVNPKPVGVTASASQATISCGSSINLFSTPATSPVGILNENFNGTTNTWTATNTSTGGTPADADWTLRPDAYAYSGTTFHSNDNSQFYMTNSDILGSGSNAVTTLESPVFSTVGMDSCSLSFYQYYSHYSGDVTTVDVFNGTVWTTVATYSATQGTATAFVNSIISLNSYIGLPTVKVRFSYNSSWGYYWAIDNVKVIGKQPNGFAWTSTPAGFTSAVQNPTGLTPIATTTYDVIVTSSLGCSATAYTAVTVNPLPVVNLGNDTILCFNNTMTLNAGAGADSYLWSTGATTSSIVIGPYTTAGAHTFYVTATTGICTNTDTIVVTADPCLGINSMADNGSILIHPNPTNGLFSIVISDFTGNDELSIFSYNGQLISKMKLNSNKEIIDLSDYPSGIYNIVINNGTEVRTSRVVIQK